MLRPISHTTAKTIAGGGFTDKKEKVVFIKLKNDKRFLLRVDEGYMHLIRSKNKRPIQNINESNARWIQGFLSRGL